ncbi:hypothetical protein GALMADRAFT_866563 [Galerina marginata CBS 339.88]|uniref:Uncharacterized protein n=1 Tax=Galerina marginata (strain CBS 339.88) TaxID=685588 RepID=A0A067TT22_GALM3|nr:hypothetical protein GALMADRAFT_866563 [Galerina marginata CBS 339.88]
MYLPKAPAQAKARPGQARVLAFGPARTFVKPEPPQARPKPGLSGQARAGTSLVAKTTPTVQLTTCQRRSARCHPMVPRICRHVTARKPGWWASLPTICEVCRAATRTMCPHVSEQPTAQVWRTRHAT